LTDCTHGTHGRNVYLAMKSPDEARESLHSRFDWSGTLDSETVAATAATGRVLAAPVRAAISSPAYHGSAMDGVAVQAARTWGASEATPKELTVGPDVVFVNTGEPLPPACDAVVMIEGVQDLGDGRIRIEAPAFPWQHVRRVGEDIVATDMLFTRHHRLTPYCVGALMAGGVTTVEVKRRPRVLIVPTGGELIAASDVGPEGPPPGAIIEFNGTMLGELVRQAGGEFVLGTPVPDDLEALVSAVSSGAREFDAVLLIGGSSAGARDLSRAAIAEVGEVLVHGVTMMPGKPTVLGAVHDTLVVGVPGYPVSAIVSFEQLVAPALAAMQGVEAPQRREVEAHPVRKIASKLGLEEFVRVRLGRVGDRLVAAPLPRGAGAITSMTRADGILRIPAHVEGVEAHRSARVELLRPRATVENTLVAIGSHDMTLDVLADLLRARGDGSGLTSTSVGSLGGLKALRDGACHLAGCHLLDPADGTYNVSYVRRFAGDEPIRLVHLVEREQGLMVPPGNLRGVRGLQDLAAGGVTFVNRQGGSGTRVLLDYELGRAGIDPDAIAGYDREETTHMAVAVAVLSGAADVGLGIRAAAKALGLDFVPVTSESYDLAIPERFFELPALARLLEVIASPAFRTRVADLGGYSTARTGEVSTP